MKDLFTKELIELSAQTASIEQLNVVIKARDIRIKELEKQLATTVSVIRLNCCDVRGEPSRRLLDYATRLESKG